jgi:hypothetical protein
VKHRVASEELVQAVDDLCKAGSLVAGNGLNEGMKSGVSYRAMSDELVEALHCTRLTHL